MSQENLVQKKIIEKGTKASEEAADNYKKLTHCPYCKFNSWLDY